MMKAERAASEKQHFGFSYALARRADEVIVLSDFH